MARKIKIVKAFKVNQEIPKDAVFLAADVEPSPSIFYYEVIVTREDQHDDLVPDFVSKQLKNDTDR